MIVKMFFVWIDIENALYVLYKIYHKPVLTRLNTYIFKIRIDWLVEVN